MTILSINLSINPFRLSSVYCRLLAKSLTNIAPHPISLYFSMFLFPSFRALIPNYGWLGDCSG